LWPRLAAVDVAWSVIEERPVGILHGPLNRWLALRVLGDLRGFGVATLLVPQGRRRVRPRWSHVRGLVVVQSSGVWWTDQELAAMHALHDSGTHVVVAHMSARPLPIPLCGMWQFPLLGDRYEVTPSGGPGHSILAEMFGGGHPPEGEQRRGYVFVSYRARAEYVTTAIVPTLIEQGFGFFDYRGTEELDKHQLRAELRRWVDTCAVLLVVASPRWPKSSHTVAELKHAHRLKRPVVVLRRPSWPPWPSDDQTVAVEFDDAERDEPGLGAAIRQASVSA
jgi:hypothetical protein